MGATPEAELPPDGVGTEGADEISYEVTFDPSSADEPSLTVFETLEMLPDLIDSGERDLVEGLDAEAIDRLFDGRLEDGIEVQFAVGGYDVTVAGDGTVRFSHPI